MHAPGRRFGAWCALLMSLILCNHVLAQEIYLDEVPAASKKEADIRDALRRYVKLFNEKDLEQLSELFGRDFVYKNLESTGESAGLDEFLEKLKASFELEPSLTLEAQGSNQIVFQAEEVATITGSAILRADETPDEVSQFSVTLRSTDDGWKISEIIDQSTEVTSSDSAGDPIDSLAWLVGTWQDDSPDQLLSTFQYLPGNRFLRRSITSAKDQTELGFEIIGYDPVVNLVRSWTYFSDGSFGSGSWSGATDHWQLSMKQTLADGQQASGTFMIKPLDEDTIIIKVVSREVGGEIMPTGKKVTMRRIDSKESDAAAAETNDTAVEEKE